MGYLSIARIPLRMIPLASSSSYSVTPTLQLSFSSESSSRCFLLLKSLPAFNSNSVSQQHSNILHTLQGRSFGGPLGFTQILGNEDSAAHSDGYGPLLQECTNSEAWAEGKQVHARMLINGLEGAEGLGAKLVNMYATCGSMADARLVFDKMCQQNVLLWNTMIRGYAWNGPYEEALTLYYRMQELGISPNNFTFPFVLKACSGLSSIEDGREIHYHIVRDRFESDVYVETALVDMYVKCNRIEDARQVFDKMSTKDAVAWNAMIAGYAQNGYANEALALFHQMLSASVKPTGVTIVSVLPACADLEALEQGEWIHDFAIRNGFESVVSVGTALIDMYAKCRRLEFARQLFDKMSKRNAISWTAMIAGYAQSGYAKEALALFSEMQLTEMMPNSGTMVSVLRACAHLAALQQGKSIHAYIIRNGFDSETNVENSLVAMYAKCGTVEVACQLFGTMAGRDVVSWNAMIAGCIQNGHASEALILFQQMQLENVKPDSVTIVSVLSACAHLAALQQGKWNHARVLRSGLESDIFVGNALIDMYAKCGSMEFACRTFNKMSTRDVVSWNAIIAGHGIHGNNEDALALFSQMQQTGIKPDGITFICVLAACSHAGMVDEGLQHFDSITRVYHLTPRLEHYICVVDLLGRAGCLDEAHDFIKRMPLEPNPGVWGALLGACRIHCNIELGERVAERLLELEPDNIGNYVLLSNIYASAGRWDGVAKVRKILKDRGMKKSPGCSWIEIKNRVHIFQGGDRSHPQSEKIYAMLDTLVGQMKKVGYAPDTSFVLHDLEEEEKQYILCTHSEKLAIAFGLIETSTRTPIRITKNLRVCGDCHTAAKFISNIARREIIVRDINRFHHFKDGLCSCGDYW